MEVEPAGQSTMTEGAVVAEQSAAEVTERAKVEIPSQPGVSTQLEVPSAQEERVKVQQSGSLSVLIPTSQVAESSPTSGVLSSKTPVTEVSFVQVLSSSSEDHVDYSRDELDFGDEPAPPDTSKFTHISRKRYRWMSLQWFRHREKLPPPRVFLLSPLIVTPLI